MSAGRRSRVIGRSCLAAAIALIGSGCTVEVAPSGSAQTSASADGAADQGSNGQGSAEQAPATTPPATSASAAAEGGAGSGEASLDELLVDTRYVPEGYTSEIVPSDRRASVVGSVMAIPVGAVVDPPMCAPRPLAADSAVLLATDPSAANLMVVVERVDARLLHLAEQWRSCSRFTVDDGAAVLVHSAQVSAAPPVATDESAALRTSVDGAADGRSQQTVTLAAQQGDIRVTAVALGRADTIDTAGLDTLFTETVLNLQNS